MHINAVALYIIMGVCPLLNATGLPKVWRGFQTPSSRSECVGYKSTGSVLAGLSSYCYTESYDIKPD